MAMPQLAADNNVSFIPINEKATAQVTEVTKMKIPSIRVHVPTLILWGEHDQAFVKENLDGIEQYVPDYTIERFADASHWLMHEKSAEINEAIARFIKK